MLRGKSYARHFPVQWTLCTTSSSLSLTWGTLASKWLIAIDWTLLSPHSFIPGSFTSYTPVTVHSYQNHKNITHSTDITHSTARSWHHTLHCRIVTSHIPLSDIDITHSTAGSWHNTFHSWIMTFHCQIVTSHNPLPDRDITFSTASSLVRTEQGTEQL